MIAGWKRIWTACCWCFAIAMLIRSKYLVDVISVTQVRGMPFRAADLAEMLQGVLTHD